MRFKLLFTCISILVSAIIGNQGYSQAPIVINSQTKAPIPATSSLAIFRDPSTKIPFEQIRKQSFKPLGKDYFIFPYTNDVHWVRLTVTNTDATNKQWTFQWLNPIVEKLDFYISDSTQQHFSHTP